MVRDCERSPWLIAKPPTETVVLPSGVAPCSRAPDVLGELSVVGAGVEDVFERAPEVLPLLELSGPLVFVFVE